jgi:hypothetical protein
MRGMKGRRKEKTGLDMIKPTSFYSSESEKVKLNWFCYELSLSIYDSMKKKMQATRIDASARGRHSVHCLMTSSSSTEEILLLLEMPFCILKR